MRPAVRHARAWPRLGRDLGRAGAPGAQPDLGRHLAKAILTLADGRRLEFELTVRDRAWRSRAAGREQGAVLRDLSLDAVMSLCERALAIRLPSKLPKQRLPLRQLPEIEKCFLIRAVYR